MAIYLKGSQANVLVGLGTFTYNIGSTAMHKISIQLSDNPASSISVVINQNGSPIATSTAPAPGQQLVDLQTVVNCTSGDVITFVLSSGANIDNQLNNIKSTITIDKVSN